MTCPSPGASISAPATLCPGSQMDVAHISREESGRVLATLIRRLGSFDLAEEVMPEAFAAAVGEWQKRGGPDNPPTWRGSTGQPQAVAMLPRRSGFCSKGAEV